jgi:phthalate 4,5-cis-dihydrodiol dehydrogenase
VAWLEFESGAAASLVYSGYDYFDSDEWYGGIGERGAPKQLSHGAARRSLASASADETRLRTETFAYGTKPPPLPEHQPHFGIMVVTCQNGDLRPYEDGVVVYDQNGRREIPVPKGIGMPGRREVLDDMAAAIRTGRRALHEGRWGKATLEVALGLLRSAREAREIRLEHQAPVPDARDVEL